jgi:DNA-binding NtrC family response regulator
VPARILVVDDDAAIRRALVRTLRLADVVSAASADEALRELSAHAFDAILTDYGIEPTNGVTLLQDVALAHPKVRRYLMSGFDADRFSSHLASGLILGFYAKPLDVAALRSGVLQNE